MNVLKGPPDAVKIRRLILLGLLPCKLWKIAECSLSTGKISTPFSLANPMTKSPAVTNVSLLAKAIVLPRLIASTVGINPIIPTTAVTTISASCNVATCTSPSTPVTTSVFNPFSKRRPLKI